MAVRPIRLFGDPVLRERAEPVADFDRELRALVADLTDTMHAAEGRGLAAPQVGVGLRVFTWHLRDGEPAHLVNPELAFPTAEDLLGPEGCLSIPGLPFDCLRRKDVVATGFDQHGEPLTIRASEVLARCIQHETDHLDGVLFVDRLDAESQRAALDAIAESEWYDGPPPVVRVSPHPMSGVAR